MTSVHEFTSAAVSDRGLNEGRPQNEDSYVELPLHGLFAVADGVGGAQAGEVASQMAVEILSEAFVNIGGADPEETMRIALERANEAIFSMSRDLPQLSSMATTIVALHVSGDLVTIAHVGDSRIYRLDASGKLFRETDDHSLVEEEVRAGRMTPEQAINHPSRNVISRALGAEDSVEPDIKCVLAHPATTFLLCSDGITRHIDDSELEELLNSDFGPDDICARMKDICFSRGAEDNLTAIIVHFAGDRTARPAPANEDFEEVTLAGIRDVVPEESRLTDDESPGNGSDVLDLGAEAIDENRSGVTENDDEAYLIDPDTLDKPNEDSDLQASPAADDVFLEVPTADPIPAKATTVSSYEHSAEGENGGWLGKVFGMLAVLAIGGILGFAGGYFYVKNAAPVAEVPSMPPAQSENVVLTTYEKTRRLVDEDPARYAIANAATPKTADDFFWLGRALLLTGKPVEAKRQFEEARKMLSTFDDLSTARTMSNEIAMALTIIDDEQGREAFAKQIAAANTAPTGSNTNSSGNRVVPSR